MSLRKKLKSASNKCIMRRRFMHGFPGSFSMRTVMALHHLDGINCSRSIIFKISHRSSVIVGQDRSALYMLRFLPDGDVDVDSFQTLKPFFQSATVISWDKGSRSRSSAGMASSEMKVASSGN